MSEPRFRPVGTEMPHAELEARIRAWWKAERVFERSVEERPAENLYSFYEGPPTANGEPGVHHVLARVFKDLFPRYQTMRGRRAPRKGGWDTHGLPVELEVERQLGLSSKSEIEQFGIAEFNRRCRDSVMAYVEQWEELTDRIAFWIDMEDAYRTYAPDYIESCWWILKTLWDRGLIYEARRTTPHCPRCETSLSSHEVAQGYREDTVDPSVYIRFRADAGSLPPALRWDGRTDILAWTTTPWTLPANSGLAVAPEEAYSVAEVAEGERLIVAAKLAGTALAGTGQARTVATVRGADLIGATYEGLFEPTEWGVPAYRFDGPQLAEWRAEDGELPRRRVIGADFVSMEEGTGVVHIAPAFGEDDYLIGRERGLTFIQPVDRSGNMSGDAGAPGAPGFVGAFVKDADRQVLDDLEARGLLLRRETTSHTYPFCWRCDAPLLYYAKPSWYIATSRLRDSLLESNQREISWHPEHVRDGRYGDWLKNNVDWAISRERYWGTPLPIWRCRECGETECFGSFDAVRERALGGADLDDPHRPYVDEVAVACRACDGEARRIPEVADAWFDSGAMPYAQWHYPFENRERFAERFPAEFICEAVDQTRGWFYSLHAEAVLLHAAEAAPAPTSYRHVLSLGHILDEAGEKMSKSRGNVVDPWSVLDAHGADALRWYCYVAAPAGNPRRFSQRLVGEAQRRFLHTLWNTYSFFTTYANIDGWTPEDAAREPASNDLDRWINSELHLLIRGVGEALDEYDATAAARRLEAFVDSLSNWWVRRSRRRFWSAARGGAEQDRRAKAEAYATLHEVLTTLARLLAPFAPFTAEEIWRNLAAEAELERAPSVHLADWPAADASAIDEGLNREMAFVQRAVSLGRAARSGAGIKVRQPLALATVSAAAAADAAAAERHAATIAAELNVKRVEVGDGAPAGARYSIKPNLRVLGPRLGPRLPALRTALSSLAPEIAQHVAQAAAEKRSIEVEGIALSAGDLLIEREAGGGGDAPSAGDDGCSVTLDPKIDEELAREGLAREVIHRVQNLRKDSGLDPADRIELALETEADALRGALEAFERLIAAETLAASVTFGGAGREHSATAEIDGDRLTLSLSRA